MMNQKRVRIVRIEGENKADILDDVTVEEPLEIRLRWIDKYGQTITKSISVTMRTPGNDKELAYGFLYTEGIVKDGVITTIEPARQKPDNNVMIATLKTGASPTLVNAERNFYTTSSCGVCGKASIESVFANCNFVDEKDNLTVKIKTILSINDILKTAQDVFRKTGGLHAAALFDTHGKLIVIREDVGRHNAMDKLVGYGIEHGLLPLSNYILMLSGRSSFELVQKAAMANIKIIVSVGAPSSLAIGMASEWGITLIGFLRENRFNIYSGAERIIN